MRRGLRVPVAWRGAPGPNYLCTRRYAGDIRPHVDFGPGLPPGRPADVKRPLSMYVVEPKGRQGSFRRFLRMARGEAPFLVGSLACVAIFSAATLAIPAGFGDLLDHASRGEMPWHTAWRLMWLVGIAGICNFGRLIFVGFAGERMVALLRERLFKAMIRQPAAFFDGQDNRTGALVQRITMDTSVAGACLTEGLNQGTKNLLQVAGSITIMLYYSTTLSAVIFCILPPAAMLAGEYGKLVRKMQSKKQDATANMGVVADERLSNVRIVKAFGRDQEELRYFNKRVRNVFGIARTMVLWNASYVAFLNVAGYLTLYCMIWAGAMLVSVDELTAGALFSFMLYTINCGMGITGVTNLITDLNKGYGASLRLFDIIDKAEKLDAQEGQLKKLKLAPCEGRFGFRDLSFAYPTRPDATVLQDFSLDLTPGQCTCVVAASGAGKSSLANLLLKLYEPSTGRVTLDGHDLQTIDTTWLRSIIGYVPQEPVLFGGTVVENIAYGVLHRNWDDKMDEWTRDSVIAAAKKANAHEFIMALPDGYETYVGEGGKSLSGGQKQRIAIARALVRSPQLLILDEATSALDSESEAVVQAAIEKLIDDARVEKQRSVLIFAHRLSMIRQADTVVVLKDGRVADKGSYEHVLQNPYFRHLVGVDSKGNPDPTKNDISAVLGRTPHHLEPDEAPPARKLKQTPVEESAVESSTPPS